MKYNIEILNNMFKEKNYTLLSKEYKGIKEKLQFICNKHKDLGVQEVTLSSFLKNKNNCKECFKEYNIKNWHSSRNFKTITKEEFREKHFAEYSDKLKNEVGDDYELIDVFKKNNYTYIKLIHKDCGTIFEIEQNKFFKRKQRCKNPICKSKKISEIHTKTTNEFKQEVFDLVGNEYIVLGEYKGTNENILLKHNTEDCKFEFLMNPHNFLSGQRCPNCAIQIRKEKSTKSQEQYEKEVYDLFGDEYTIIGKYINSKESIKIRHNTCGHIFEISSQKMLDNTVHHCPFCSYPTRGEQRIINYLDKYNEEYEYQKRYKDLHGVGNGLLSYDFYIPRCNLLIEYQGNFHDGTVNMQTEENFEIQKEHDKRKRNYAKSHNINLLEIWYWDFNNIENILKNKIK